MRVEARNRREQVKSPGDLELSHLDLVLVCETEEESILVDSMGQPGTTFTGEVRLSDGYGEHYLLVQPKHVVGDGFERDVP